MRPIPKVEGLVVGSSLAAVGVLWTLANLGQLDLLATLRGWWPAVLVVWGLLELYNWRAEVARRDVPPPPGPTDEPRWYDKDDESGRTS